LVLAAVGAALWAGCRRDPAADQAGNPVDVRAGSDDRPVVFVSILPQAYFVERIAGERFRIEVLVPPGQSAHSLDPTPAQVQALGRARVFFCIGVEFERTLVPKLRQMFPGLEICDTRQGVPLRRMEVAEAHHDHEHPAHEAEHEHGGTDPHIWLSPRLVKIQAQTICDGLCRIDPEHAEQYRRNLRGFQADLDELDARLAAALAPIRGKELFVFHPAYGYFAEAYGLRQVAVEIAGKEPSARELAELVQRARAAGAKVIFVQPQFSTRTAEALAEQIGAAVVPLDPLARDYLANVQAMAEAIEKAISREPAARP